MRETIQRDGVTLFRCTHPRCGKWLPRDAFYRLANPRSRCGISSWCTACENAQRKVRKARQQLDQQVSADLEAA